MNHYMWFKVPTCGEVKTWSLLHQAICQSVVPVHRYTVKQMQWTQLLAGRPETDFRECFSYF